MRPVQVDPAIRSAPNAARALSGEEIKALRTKPYREYLKTQWWYRRRNQALRDAGYRCESCETKRELQVHHKSYQRLGCEEKDDLLVVCRGCHLGHHFNETQESIGIYVRVLSSVIHECPDAEFADVVETAKQRCAASKIHLNHDKFNAAVARVNNRISFRPPEHKRELYEVSKEGEPLTKAEAAGILNRLGLAVAMKHMPEVKIRTVRQTERLRAVAILMEGIAAQSERCDEAERAAEQGNAHLSS